MQKPIKLQLALDPVGADSARKLELFALLTLGIIEQNCLVRPDRFDRSSRRRHG